MGCTMPNACCTCVYYEAARHGQYGICANPRSDAHGETMAPSDACEEWTPLPFGDPLEQEEDAWEAGLWEEVRPMRLDSKWDGYTAPWSNPIRQMDASGHGAITHWRYADVPEPPRD